MKLHIISSDVPFPPDYGGMVDVFYKVKNLHEAGLKIYLHCFEYGRGTPKEMNAYCEEVFYYKRKTGWKGLSLTLPYMLYSRRDKNLLFNLQKIEAPILFEGVHTTYYLSHPTLKKRFKIIRNQNLEQEYYALLAQRESNLLRKAYYRIESLLLKSKENKLADANAFFTVAEHDHAFFKENYPQKIHEYIPSFQPYNHVITQLGIGKYCLYHGNLGHPENIEAALFLLENVCPRTTVKFIFAGKDPDSKIINACNELDNCTIVANPNMQDMTRLIAEAHIHVLPTFQATGLKLKLLHALFNGRHIIANMDMVAGTGLETVCHIASTPLSFAEKIMELMNIPFDHNMKAFREELLKQRYNNIENAKRIITFLPQ